jgi:hypothetical protein
VLNRRVEEVIRAEISTATGDVINTTDTVVEPICHWFGLCGNPGTSTERHFLVGDVPICATCQDKLEKMKAQQCPTT